MLSKAEGKDYWRYGWDYENRLVEASTRKRTVRYRYDALGRRTQRYFIKGGKDNTKFTYDGQDVVMDNNDGVITKYQNGLGIDNKLKLTTNGTSKYFLQDHLGSTTGLTNSSGSITESTSYDSFGNSTNNLSTRYSYTGREYDNFTGLYYYRARFYDAKLGRFISEDPIGFVGGDVNLFGYVGNNVTNFSDPLGLARTHRDLNSFGFGDCEELLKQIKELEGSIKERSAELSYRKRVGLGFDDGHSKRLAGERKALEKVLRRYKALGCGDADNDNDSPKFSPFPVPAPKKNEECEKRRIPLGNIPLNQPTMEELRLNIDYHENMAKFWGTIAAGSAIAGAAYLAPGVIPALIPAAPRIIQFAH
jgi:RHS repeat-associated protein